MFASWFDGFAAADTRVVFIIGGLLACLIVLGMMQSRFKGLRRTAQLIGAIYLTVLLILLTWPGRRNRS